MMKENIVAARNTEAEAPVNKAKVQILTNKKPKPSRELPGYGGMTLVGTGIGIFSSLVGIVNPTES